MMYDVCVSGNMEDLYNIFERIKGHKIILSHIKLSVYDEFHWTNFHIQFNLISKLMVLCFKFLIASFYYSGKTIHCLFIFLFEIKHKS